MEINHFLGERGCRFPSLNGWGVAPRPVQRLALRTSVGRPGWTAEASADNQPRPNRPLSRRTVDPRSSSHTEGLRQPEGQRPASGTPLRLPRAPARNKGDTGGPTRRPPGRTCSPRGDRGAPTRGSRWPTAGARPRRAADGYPGTPIPRAARPLPARHSAPRADTARGAAEPSRRAASALESPWPALSGERGGSACCASLPRPVSRWSWPNAGRKTARSAARSPAVSRCPTLAARACAVRTGARGRCEPGAGEGGGGTWGG